MDVDSIPPGSDFVELLSEKVDRCRLFLAIVGPDWLGISSSGRRIDANGDFVRIELAAALSKSKIVVPIFVDGADPSSLADLPEDLSRLARLQGMSIRHDRFSADAEAVVEFVKNAVGDATPARAFTPGPDAEKRARRALIDACIAENPVQNLYRLPDLSPDQQKNLSAGFGAASALSPVAFVDFTSLQNAVDGLLITEYGIHLKNMGSNVFFRSFEDLRERPAGRSGFVGMEFGGLTTGPIGGGLKRDDLAALLNAIPARLLQQ